MTTTTISITSVNGMGEGNVTNARLFADENSDGDIDVGEDPVGATGTVSIANGSGTIQFGGSWTVTSTMDIILRIDVAAIDDGDNFKLSFSPSQFNVKGASSSITITVTGSSDNVNHGKPQRGPGGGSGGSASPPAQGQVQTGGTPGGGPGTGGEGGDPGGGNQGGGTPGGGDDGGAP